MFLNFTRFFTKKILTKAFDTNIFSRNKSQLNDSIDFHGNSSVYSLKSSREIIRKKLFLFQIAQFLETTCNYIFEKF